MFLYVTPLLQCYYTIASNLSFLARDVIYTSRAYATMSVSVCPSVYDGSALVHYS